MADELKVIVKSVLEADEKSSVQSIANQLPNIEKAINSQRKIKVQLDLNQNSSGLKSQLAPITKQTDALGNSAANARKKAKSLREELTGINSVSLQGLDKKIRNSIVAVKLLEKQAGSLKNITSAGFTNKAKELGAQLRALELHPNGQKKWDEYAKAAVQADRLTRTLKLLKQEQQSINGQAAFDKKMKDAIAGISVLESKFRNFNKQSDSALVQEANKLNTQLKALESQPFGKKKTTEYSKLLLQVNELRRALRLLNQEQQNANKQAGYDKLLIGIEKVQQRLLLMRNTYSAMVKDSALMAKWQNLYNSAPNVKTQAELAKLNAEMGLFQKQVEVAGKSTQTWWGSLSKNIAKFASWFAIGNATAIFVRNVKQMFTNVKELDTAMLELRRVTHATNEEYEAFLNRAKAKAPEAGFDLTDLVKATADFSRLGYALNDAEVLGQTATIYQNVGDDVNSIEDATNSLISTMKAFGIEAKDSVSIIDKLNDVSNKESISAGGLGEALQRSASALAAANNTLDESLALIVAGNEVVRDPAAVGTGLKTMSLRIRGASADLSEMGEEVDELVQSTPKLQKELKALTGVDIMFDSQNFKSTYEILQGISKVWGDLSDVNQASVLEILFGKRQANIGASILTNFASAERTLGESLNSAGSAMKEHSVWLDSIEAKQQQAKAQFEVFSNTIVNSSFVKGFYDASTGILGFLTTLVEKLGTLPALAAVAAAALSFKNIGNSNVNMPCPAIIGMAA